MKIKIFHQQIIINGLIAVYFCQEIIFSTYGTGELTFSTLAHGIGLGWCLAAMVYLGFLEVKQVLFDGIVDLNKSILKHNSELVEQNKIRFEKK